MFVVRQFIYDSAESHEEVEEESVTIPRLPLSRPPNVHCHRFHTYHYYQ